ncbi:SH3 domain-containing protein [Cytobacillus solani]|uniref:SH3 domain-containing protein n=1 Tax=Cytobacillus solani TaxID=1637975 RepID=UPI0006ABB540|nr:SH3 domain-containing protein [Cytobacillus solani]USK53881.1 SH3 domain-containing protein [Cytobacillus solani]
MHRKKKAILFFCFILLIGISPIHLSPASAAGQNVKIGIDRLNIREGPGLSYPVVAQVNKGESYTYLSEKKDWIEIQLKDGKKGWAADWLVTLESGEINSTSVSQSKNNHATIIADGLRVRKGPGTNYQVIGTINKGKNFQVLATDGDWIQLDTPNGAGWVSSEFVQFKSNSVNSTPSKTIIGKITSNSLNIRSEPSLNGSIIGKLNAGDKVKILSQKNGWTEISYSGNHAWVSSQYVEVDGGNAEIKEQTPQESSKSSKPGTGTVTATTLTVRSKGSLNGKAIGSVSMGQTFTILEEANNWVKIEFKKGSYGWVANWYLEKPDHKGTEPSKQTVQESTITILHNGSNIRKSADPSSAIVERADQGATYDVISIQNDWYEVRLANGKSGFIAGWIVSVNGPAPVVQKPGSTTSLKNKKIVIDPGHGGRDNGTTGVSGTIEKTVTLKTAKLLYDKLKAAGANVILTRNTDTFIPLSSRVYTAQYHNADAFISIHYDSIADRSVRGMTTYYYHSYQKGLAADVHSSVASNSSLKNRDYRFGDYYVLRENKRNAILLELGYLSNPTEEMIVTSGQYQEMVTTGIYQGLAKHFN